MKYAGDDIEPVESLLQARDPAIFRDIAGPHRRRNEHRSNKDGYALFSHEYKPGRYELPAPVVTFFILINTT